MEKRDIIVLFLFVVLGIGIYFYFSENNISENILHLNVTTPSTEKVLSNPIPCKHAPEHIQNIIDNMSSYFDGIFYNKSFLLCVKFDRKDYCLQSKVVNVNGMSITYFDKICAIENSIDYNLPFVEVEYEKIQNFKELNKSILLKFAYFSDKNLYKAFKNS